MSLWERTPTGHKCTVHNVEFRRGEVCTACTTAPGKPIEVTAGDDNEHDHEMTLREAECVRLAKMCHRIGEELLQGKTDRDTNAAAKIIGEGTKLIRFACDLREKRAAREHSLRLLRHEREMSGLRKGN